MEFEYGKHSVEEIIKAYDLLQKEQNEEMRMKMQKEQDDKNKKCKDKILNQVFGKEKKLKLEQTLASKKPEERFKELERLERDRDPRIDKARGQI